MAVTEIGINHTVRRDLQFYKNMRSRFSGCMLGSAIGDSIGMAVEAFSRQRIQRQFGAVIGPLALKVKEGTKPAGSWTDDTYLSMLTAKSILVKGKIDVPHMTSLFVDGLNYDFGIAGTTKRALELRARGEDISSLGKGRHGGAGPSSRVAPVALFCFRDLAELQKQSEAVARITHDDTDSVAGAVSIAMTIAWALRGELEPTRLLGDLSSLTKGLGSNLSYNFELASDLLRKNTDTLDGIDEIGADGASVRLIPSAIFAFLKHQGDFAQAVLSSVNAGGDTDTRAAIVGAISGAYNTGNAIPNNWVNRLSDSSVVKNYAERLFAMINRSRAEGD